MAVAEAAAEKPPILKPAHTGNAIRAKGLTKKYGDFTAVDKLDLAVDHGEIYGLLGPNGAGKTTTILMLLGLSEPSGGTARVLDYDPALNPTAVKREVGYLPDNVGFYSGMTGRQNVRYTARLNRHPQGCRRRSHRRSARPRRPGRRGRQEGRDLLARHASAPGPGGCAGQGAVDHHPRRAHHGDRPGRR